MAAWLWWAWLQIWPNLAASVIWATRRRIPGWSLRARTASASDTTLMLPGGLTRRSVSLIAGPARA